MGLMTGPLWGRKAWGVWWQWDARLTSALVMWLVFVAYLLLRKYGGPGSEKLSAVLALFGMANVPFVYWSVNVWRTVHPKTSVVMTLQPAMGLSVSAVLAGIRRAVRASCSPRASGSNEPRHESTNSICRSRTDMKKCSVLCDWRCFLCFVLVAVSGARRGSQPTARQTDSFPASSLPGRNSCLPHRW